MKIAVYPGSFDPITYGHIDIIERSIELFDRVDVIVATHPGKQPLFTPAQRLALIREATEGYPTVRVDIFDGLIVEYARNIGAVALIRGLRAMSDFEFEFQMALMNRKLAAQVATVFLMPNEKHTYLNSSIVRELARLRTDISDFVPPGVQKALAKLYPRNETETHARS